MDRSTTTITGEVYEDGNRLIGKAEVELPNIEPLTATVKGAGISGEPEVPILGHVGNMTAKITWIDTTPDVRRLMVQKYHHLEVWSAKQVQNSSTGEFEVVSQKHILRACPAGTTVGKIAVGEVQGTESNFNVSYFKWVFGNDEICEIDVFNQIYRVGGQDLLSKVRAAVGL